MNEDAERVAEVLAEAVQALRDGTEYDGMDAETFLTEMVLEVEVHGKRQLGDDEWMVTKVEVLLGYGGPTYWVKFGETDQAYVEFVWSSESSSYQLSPDLAEQLAVIWGIVEVLT